MKKLFALMLAMLLALSCFTAFAEEEVVELFFQRIGTDAPEKAYWEQIIAEFEAAHLFFRKPFGRIQGCGSMQAIPR